MAPHAVITDRDLALMNALQRVPFFIHSFNILCIWQIKQEYRKEPQNWDWARRMGQDEEEDQFSMAITFKGAI